MQCAPDGCSRLAPIRRERGQPQSRGRGRRPPPPPTHPPEATTKSSTPEGGDYRPVVPSRRFGRGARARGAIESDETERDAGIAGRRRRTFAGQIPTTERGGREAARAPRAAPLPRSLGGASAARIVDAHARLRSSALLPGRGGGAGCPPLFLSSPHRRRDVRCAMRDARCALAVVLPRAAQTHAFEGLLERSPGTRTPIDINSRRSSRSGAEKVSCERAVGAVSVSCAVCSAVRAKRTWSVGICK